MKFILGKKIIIFYMLVAAALISVLAFFYYNTLKVKSARQLVEHTQEVLRTSDNVLLDILDIETGARGYLLTGSEVFSAPIQKAATTLNSNLVKLEQLTQDNQKQQKRIKSLKKSADERLVLIKSMIDAKKLDKLEDAETKVIVEQGKVLTGEIRTIIAEINFEESNLLTQRKIAIEKNNKNSEIIFLLLVIFIIVIFILVNYILKNQKIRNNELEEFTASRKLLSNYSLTLIEASLDPLITINTEGKITDMNEALANITGMTREKLTGSDFFDYFTEPQKAREVYQEVFAKGSVADSPLTLRHKNGKLTDVLFNGSVYKDDMGKVLGVVIVARDVTAQKLLSKYSLSLIEASLDPLITINTSGKITDMNDALVNITGKTRKNLTGTDFFDYFTEPQKAREVYQEVFAKGSVADSPLSLRHENGKLTNVLFNGSVYKDDRGNVLGAVVVARDIAEQKWATELRIVNKELAFQNQEKENRAAELFIANKELLFQNGEKEKRADELSIAIDELAYQNQEKENRAAELVLANEELAYQNEEKEKRAAELYLANKELVFQNKEKEKRAAELFIANKELVFQNDEKEKRAAELILANKELVFQNEEKKRREIANKELEAFSYSLKLASQYARSLIEASLDPLFTINPAGKITDMNEASVNITGISREKLIGTNFFDYFTEPQNAREVYQEVFANGFVADYPLTMIDGELTDVLLNGSVYKDDRGNVLGVVVVARDITEQKRIEKELIEAKVFAELATIIAEEAKIKAESATHIAENAVKAKQQFLSNMSHEIRTPMNAIIGFTKVVLKTELSSKQKEYLTAIKMSGDALIVLINDILDLAKVDAGKMVFEQTPFKIALSISAMLHLFETKIQEKNLKLVKEYDQNIPEVLVGDPVRLHQIILNLVSNAVKFTTNGKITVSVHLLSEDDDKVTIEFSVSDTGIGIAEEKIGKIFDNFQQASSGTSRLYGGTGLGLAIVKQLVEPQGGSIRVTSKIDEGSTFSFILSFLKTDAEAEIETEIEKLDSEIKNIRVLVAEDIPLNQLLMRTLLDDFGFEREIAANGKIAIEKLQSDSFDVILMDLQMPEMNGFETTDYIRNIMHSDIPIIALTADVTTVDLAKCKAVGMNDYISKPVDERLLYNKIVGIVKKPSLAKYVESEADKIIEIIKFKCTNLDYLTQRTKSNPALMMEMISAYLEQTPPLIKAMKTSFRDKEWGLLYSSVHKMIPSFSIMGMSTDFENMAKKVQEIASTQKQTDGITEMVIKLGNVCTQACEELEEELIGLKKHTHE